MAITKEINLVVETDEAVKNVNKLNKSVEGVEQSSKDIQKQNEATKKSFKGLTTGAKAFGTALKAAGIGLVIALFAKLSELLQGNQKIVDLVNTAWTALGTVMKDVGEAIFNFDESLAAIGDTLKNIVLERIKLTLSGIKLLGSSINAFLSGNFKTAKILAEQGVKDLTRMGGAAEDLLRKGKEYVGVIIDEADAYTKLNSAALIAEATQRRIFEQSDRDAERQRERRDNFNLSAQERIEASEKLLEILNLQEETQLRLGKINVQRAQEEIRLKGYTDDRQVALINALAELDGIEADITGRRTEQAEQDRMLRKEILDARKEEISEIINTDNLVTNNKIQNLDAEVQAVLNARMKEAEINEKASREEQQRAQYLEDFKLNVAQAGLAALGNLAESGSAFAKGIAIAQAIISTYQGINKALAETTDFTPTQTLRFANAAAVGIAGFANVANILKTNATKPSGGGVGSVPSAPAAPSFNVVGTGGVNQLAQTLNQEQDPVKAFVVGGDVTSQQEMDRDVVNTATIG